MLAGTVDIILITFANYPHFNEQKYRFLCT